jgi:DNA-binding SARP family transcriptional activator
VSASTNGSGLRVRILGPLRLWRDGVEVDPGPRQQARLLALLLTRTGRTIGKPELIHLLWGDAPPTSALNVVHKYVGGLRRILEPALAPREHGSYLHSRGYGYLVTTGPDELDLASFRVLTRAASIARASGDDDAALDTYVDALGLWHGSTAESLMPDACAAPVAAALDEEFLRTCDAAAEVALALGRTDRVLPALDLAASLAPLRETTHAHLVTALGAQGRRADALAAFLTIRTRLADDLGIDPGPELRAAHRRVLDPTWPAQPVRGIRTGPLVVTVKGTARPLADDVAGLFAEEFPDGHLYLSLRPGLTLGAALGELLRSLGVPEAGVPRTVAAQAAAYRSATAGKRLLVFLDDATDAAQVRPLLPDSAGCLVVVSSRTPLSHLAALDCDRLLLALATLTGRKVRPLAEVAAIAPGPHPISKQSEKSPQVRA